MILVFKQKECIILFTFFLYIAFTLALFPNEKNKMSISIKDSTNTASISGSEENKIWSAGSAFTIPRGRFEVGIFQPLQYGFNESTEFYGFPLLFFIMPNFGVKKRWPEVEGINLTTMHTISCPTFLLKTISREGTGGILPKEAIIPFILSFENHVLTTFIVNKYLAITPKAGFALSLVSGNSDFPTIDYHLFYPRTADYHESPTFNFGLDLQGKIIFDFDYYVDGDIFLLALEEGNFTFEHKFMILWKKSSGFNILAGYKYSIGKFPFTINKKLYPSGYDSKFFPIIDLQWGFSI